MPISPLAPLQNTLVGGKYRVRDVIGSGGVGTVYRATHVWTEREVAVKVLNPNLPHFDQLRDAFLQEARATVQLEHPNVVDVLDMGEDRAGTTYLVMELLDGPNLRDVLFEQGRLCEEDTASILLPLVDALETAHERGIVHNDFKPENIILSVDALGVMTPKLLDFGVAQLVRRSQPQRSATARQVIVGTPHYMSPEQARDQRNLIGPQTDVWGVGVVWYECLTGRCPFDGETPLDVLTAVCEAPIDFAGIPAPLASVLQNALQRSVTKRTPSLAMLRQDLERTTAAARSTHAGAGRRSSRPPQRERPSYVRRNHGVRPSSQTATRRRSVQLDSELLTLPSSSHRKTAIGGLALTVAVGLAAWWTVGGAPTKLPTPSPRAEDVYEIPPAEPAVEEPAEPVRADPLEPVETERPEPQAPPGQEMDVASGSPPSADPVVTPLEAEREPAEAEEEPARTTSSPSRATPKTRRTRPIERRDAPSQSGSTADPTYEKPPELITEW